MGALTAQFTTSYDMHLRCLIKLHPSTGGAEAMLFAGDLLRTYTVEAALSGPSAYRKRTLAALLQQLATVFGAVGEHTAVL